MNGRERMSKAPTFCASALGLLPLYPVIIRRMGGAVAPPFFRISRITSALGSRGSMPDRSTRSNREVANCPRPSSPSWATVTRYSGGASRPVKRST